MASSWPHEPLPCVLINAVIPGGRGVSKLEKSTTLRYVCTILNVNIAVSLTSFVATNLYLTLEECFMSIGRHLLAHEQAFTKFHQMRLEHLPLVWKH